MTATRQRMLVIGKTDSAVTKIKELTGEKVEVISADDVTLPDASADFVVVESSEPQLMSDLQVSAMGLLSALPDGIVLLDEDLNIRWHNTTFRQLLRTADVLIGKPLQDTIRPADGTDLRRIAVPASPGEAASLTVRREDRSSLGLRLTRTTINLDGSHQQAMILTARDVSTQVLEKQKQDAIYRAGLEMGNLTTEEVTAMSHEERIILLKDQILQFTQEILGYDTFEIRLNDN